MPGKKEVLDYHWCVLDLARLLLYVGPMAQSKTDHDRQWVEGAGQIEVDDLQKGESHFARYIRDYYKLKAPLRAYRLMVNLQHADQTAFARPEARWDAKRKRDSGAAKRAKKKMKKSMEEA